MDALDILEAMAANASYDADTIDEDTVERWQKMFGYSAEEAEGKIEEQRDDLTAIVSEALWHEISEQQIALGHDRETYSHWLRLPHPFSEATSVMLRSARGERSITAHVAEVAKLASVPEVFEGVSEKEGAEADHLTQFCKVDGATKQAIIAWVKQFYHSFRPMFVMRSLSRKNLDTASISPTLGRDATLPQHRLEGHGVLPSPVQGEYPVWSFIYGTLANQQMLHTVLKHLDGEDRDIASCHLRCARICGGDLTTWGNKYKALVHGKVDNVVLGLAFLVESRLHEEALRSYETSAYEVVRCQIEFCDGERETLPGCTFRLAKS